MLNFVLPVQYLRQIAELVRVFGVNHLNQVAIGREGVVLFVDGDGAVELVIP